MKKIDLDTTPVINTPTMTTDQSSTANESTHESKTVVDELSNSDNNDNSMKFKPNKLILSLSLVAILAGSATGYGGFKLKSQNSAQKDDPTSAGIQRVAEEGKVKAGDIFGVKDEQTFKDSAQGYLEIGGINGEGSHKIIRPGGDSQTVYLTSSITDLDKFDKMEVKVWGETFKGQNAGWLMDVGRIEVINPEGKLPTQE